MFKKSLIIITISTLMASVLCGCGALRTNEKKDSEASRFDATNNSARLYDGQYYIWHDDEQSNIEKDINCDASRFKDYNYKVFKPVFTDEKISSNVLMMLEKNDEKIPVYHEGDCLIYYSTKKIPDAITFTKYYDHGYSLGIYGLREKIQYSGQYVIGSEENVKVGSSVDKIISLFKKEISTVSLAQVGEIAPSADNLSTIGTLKGLIRGSKYEVCVYGGTDRYLINAAEADTRIFSRMGDYTGYTYSMVSNGIMKIEIPPYFESGYYSINDAGIFKYVKDSDDDNFNAEIDKEKVKDYENTLILNQEKLELTDSDFINDNDISSTDIRAYSVESGEMLSITLSVGNIKDSSVKSYPEVMVYNASVSDSDKNGKNNAITHVFKVNEGDGDSFSVNLGSGHYIIILKNIKNYDKYLMSLSVEPISNNSLQ